MKRINNILKKDWFILILIILGFGIGAYFYRSLPNKVPIHWNASGHVNRYGSKFFGCFGIPMIISGIYLFMIVLPYIDPKRKNYDKFKSTYQYLKYILVILFLGIEIITILIAKNTAANNPIFIQAIISLIFILIGNVMGRIKNNYFIGIRTPWTLANDEIWRKTHRMAGPLWVIGGILNILLVFTGVSFNGKVFIAIIIIICVAPIIYSYVLYNKIYYEK